MCALVVPDEILERVEEIWRDGYNKGYDDAEETLGEEPFFAGYEAGFNEGYDECQEELATSYEEAFEDGHQVGYDEGFSVAARGALEAATAVTTVDAAPLTGEECACEACICLELTVLADWADELQDRIEEIEFQLGIKYVG